MVGARKRTGRVVRDPLQCIRERVQRPMGYGPESVGSSCPWQTECVTKGGAQLADERLSLGPGRLQSLPGNFRQRGLVEVSSVLHIMILCSVLHIA